MKYDELILAEKHKYDLIWNRVPSYRDVSAAEKIIPVFLRSFGRRIKKGYTIIDYGCGTGRAAKTFLSKGLYVNLIDLSSNCLDSEILLLTRLLPEQCRFLEACIWNLPNDLPAGEWGYCCDVLEHLPPDKVEAALMGISSRTLKGALFSIYLTVDEFGQVLGQPLHLIIRSKVC